MIGLILIVIDFIFLFLSFIFIILDILIKFSKKNLESIDDKNSKFYKYGFIFVALSLVTIMFIGMTTIY